MGPSALGARTGPTGPVQRCLFIGATGSGGIGVKMTLKTQIGYVIRSTGAPLRARLCAIFTNRL